MQKVVFFPKFFTNFSVLGYLSMAFVSVRFEILFWQARVVRRFAPPSVGDSLPSVIYIYVLPHFSFYNQERITGENKDDHGIFKIETFILARFNGLHPM